MMTKSRRVTKFWSENPKKADHLKGHGVDEMRILQFISEKLGERVHAGFILLGRKLR
jgi:hypothetical protein